MLSPAAGRWLLHDGGLTVFKEKAAPFLRLLRVKSKNCTGAVL
jgi:hypothetical protein